MHRFKVYCENDAKHKGFPAVMLHRNQAWPAQAKDAEIIDLMNCATTRQALPATITLTLLAFDPPSDVGWREFGWIVVSLSGPADHKAEIGMPRHGWESRWADLANELALTGEQKAKLEDFMSDLQDAAWGDCKVE